MAIQMSSPVKYSSTPTKSPYANTYSSPYQNAYSPSPIVRSSPVQTGSVLGTATKSAPYSSNGYSYQGTGTAIQSIPNPIITTNNNPSQAPPSAAPDPAQIKRDNVSKISTEKGSDVALDYATNYADQMSPDQYYSMIDQEAQNSQNFLNTQEASIRADQPGIEQGITDQQTLLNDKALNTKEDAQSAARRLYSELQQGYRQRFGGASSAGEAAMSLTNNEQQRQMAQNNRTYQDAVAQVDLSASQAVQSAQSEFRNQLLEITKNRTAVESERLAARRQALSDLSQKVFAIQQQRTQFQQNLQLMQEEARLSNNKNLSSLSNDPTTNLGFNGQKNISASANQGLDTAIGFKNFSGLTKNEDPIGSGILGQYNPQSRDYFLNQR
jgi:hypothetical protein